MPKLHSKQHFRWAVNPKITAFTVLLLPILLAAGYWQLSRAEEKRERISRYQSQQALPPIAYGELQRTDAGADSWRRVVVEGQFDPQHYWLLENRYRDNSLGYEVVMPFHATEGEWLLVNRGWIQQVSADRSQLPAVATPSGQLRITGALHQPSKTALVEERVDSLNSWPHRILEVDVEIMERQVQREFADRVIRLDPDSPAALDIGWQVVNMTPQKHIGYAVQWFSMAAVLLLLWLFTNSNITVLLKTVRKNKINE